MNHKKILLSILICMLLSIGFEQNLFSHLGHVPSVVVSGHVDAILLKSSDLKSTWRLIVNSYASSTQMSESISLGHEISYTTSRMGRLLSDLQTSQA